MALFFSSHLCNPLCAALGLTQFDLSEKERAQLKQQQWSSSSSATTTTATAAGGMVANIRPPPPARLLEAGESTVEAFQWINLDLQLPLQSPSGEEGMMFGDLDSPGIDLPTIPEPEDKGRERGGEPGEGGAGIHLVCPSFHSLFYRCH